MRYPKSFIVYADPGHAWLKVSKALLKELGIASKISGYSYMRGTDAYLEEDSDMGIFLDAYRKAFGHNPKFNEKYSDRSRIRSYDSYKYRAKSNPRKRRNSGKRLTKEQKLRRIVKNQQYEKINGVIVDMYSASAIVQVIDALSPEMKKDYLKLPIAKMQAIAFRLLKNNPRKRRNSSDYILKLTPAQVEVLFDYHGGQTSMFYSVASQALRGGQAKIRRQDMEYFQNELYSAMNIAENNGYSGDLRSLKAIERKVEKL